MSDAQDIDTALKALAFAKTVITSLGRERDAALRKVERLEEKLEKAERPKGGELARSAHWLCQKPAFWKYLSKDGSGVSGAEVARATLCGLCGVESRAELDHNQAAGERYLALRTDFEVWMEGYE